jgi:transcriptional/translational regulatory protein YebC/TACO1
MFNRKSVFEFTMPEGFNLEETELELIDAGLEEIEIVEDKVFVYGDYTAFGTLSQALEDLNIDVQKSSLERIATQSVSFTEDELADIEKMLDKIEDDDDILQVFTNIE